MVVSFASSSSSSIKVIFEENNTPDVSSSLVIILGSNPIIGNVDFPAPIFFDGDFDEKGLLTT